METARASVKHEILADYLYLEPDDLRACLAYAALEVSHSILFTAA